MSSLTLCISSHGLPSGPPIFQSIFSPFYHGGHISGGGATVILAMGDGRRAANSIHEYLETGVWEVPEQA